MEPSNRKRAAASLALACTVLLSGCSGMRLYNETRNKQGEAASKAWSEVDLPAYFQSQRDERKKLLQAELDAVTLHVMTRRENTMRVVANGTVEDFDVALGTELSGLVDGNIKQLDDWEAAVRILTIRRRELAFSRDLLSLHEPTLANCAAAPKSGPISSKKAASYLDAFKRDCKAEGEASKAVAELEKSLGGAYGLALQGEATRVEDAKKGAVDATNDYKVALKAYEDAVNGAPGAGEKASERIAEAAGKLRKTVDVLLKLDDEFGFGKEAVAKEKVTTLSELLEKIESGANPGKDAGHAEIQALMLPRIADDLQAINTLNKTAPKAALIIRRDIEHGRANAAALEVSCAQQRVALTKLILASRFEEALLIRSAKKKLGSAMKASGLAAQTFATALSQGNAEIKGSLIGAAGDYLDAIGRQRTHTQRLETMKTAIAHERSIAYAENSASQWSTLIGSVVGQTAEYAAGGQKFSEYKDLIQSLTLLWIGRGVNK